MDQPIETRNSPPAWHSVTAWSVIALVLVAEYVLFCGFALREITWTVPINYDQCVYLDRSYEIYETIVSKGLPRGLELAWQKSGANGTQLPLQAALLYLAIGPSRLSALTLSFAYFALFQAVLAGTVRRTTGRWSAAFLALGILLAARTTFLRAGGIMDFRIDFTAACLYGTFLCAVSRSEMFRSWGWSVGVGAVATLLILFRFVTAPYLVGVLGLLFLMFCVRIWLGRGDPTARSVRLRQLGGLLLAGLIVTAVVLPAVLLKWNDIRSYYIGHLSNGESEIRCEEFGYTGLAARLLYYPHSLFVDHLGTPLLIVSGIVLAAALALGFLRFRERRPTETSDGLLFAALCAIVPLSILTAWSSPSPVVADVAVGALPWLVVLTALRLLGLPRSGGSRWCSRSLAVLAAIAMAVGAIVQISNYSHRAQSSKHRTDLEQCVAMYERIGQHAQRMGWTMPTILHNVVSDQLCYAHVNLVSYERHGVRVDAQEQLANRVGAVSEAEALAAIGKSDFVILRNHAAGVHFDYPFNECMRDLYPAMQAECDRTHVVLHRFRFLGDDVTVYARAATESLPRTVPAMPVSNAPH